MREFCMTRYYLKFSSIFQSILPYQGKFRPEATRNLSCNFATLSIPLQARDGKQMHLIHYLKRWHLKTPYLNGTMHLMPYLKHYHYELPQKFTQHENINLLINRHWVDGYALGLMIASVTFVSKGRVPMRSTASVEQPIELLLSGLTY